MQFFRGRKPIPFGDEGHFPEGGREHLPENAEQVILPEAIHFQEPRESILAEETNDLLQVLPYGVRGRPKEPRIPVVAVGGPAEAFAGGLQEEGRRNVGSQGYLPQALPAPPQMARRGTPYPNFQLSPQIPCGEP